MKRILTILIVTLCLFASGILFSAINPESPFQVMWDDAPIKVEAGKKFKTTITIRVPQDHFIYADKTDVDFASLEGIRIDDIKFPRPETRKDPYFGKTMEVYRNDVVITITGHIPANLAGGKRELIALLDFQGCSQKLCLRPEEQEIVFNIDIIPIKAGETEPKSRQAAKEGVPSLVSETESIRSLLKSHDFGEIASRGLAFSILIVFIAGMLVSLTPCIWPVIPIVLLTIGVEAQKKWWKNIGLAVVFVLGLVLTNAILGVLAAHFGRAVGFLFQSRVFLIMVVLFFVAMSLSMFGLFEFHPFRVFHEKLHKVGGKGFRGALLMGMATGLIASPCASPILVSLLGYVTIKQSYFMGFWLLAVFGFGMGLLFIVISSAFGILADRWKRARWTIWVKRCLGIMLLIPATFYLRSVVRWNGVFHPGIDAGKPRVEWIFSHEEALKFARQSKMPLMVEFYADWCPPCRALETSFFKKDDIIKLSYRMVPVRIDATVATPEAKKAIAKYHVIGWPAIYFLSPEGDVYKDLTVISYDPKKIEMSMYEAIARAEGGPL